MPRVIDIVFSHGVLQVARITNANSNMLHLLGLFLVVACCGLDLLYFIAEAIVLVKVELNIAILPQPGVKGLLSDWAFKFLIHILDLFR